jgi:GDSL-like Lipase/Acylhydrolase
MKTWDSDDKKSDLKDCHIRNLVPFQTTAFRLPGNEGMRLVRPRDYFINAGILFSTVLICFVGAEVVLRANGKFSPVQMGWVGQFHTRPAQNFIVDPQTGWRMRPNHSFEWFQGGVHTYTSNSQGFRTASNFDAHDSRLKIAFVGDSFVFGTGVSDDETFPALVERDAPNRVSWNFGMPGFGVDQVWLSTRYQALPLKPDLVVVGLINADFERSEIPFRRTEGFEKPTFKLVNGQLTLRSVEPKPNVMMRYLDEYSRVWSMWVHAQYAIGVRYGVGQYWTLNRAFIDAIRADCKQSGVPALFVYIPIKGLSRFDPLAQYMHQTGADYIDLWELLHDRPHGNIYLQHDMHLSKDGHRFIADQIENWMKYHPQRSAKAR